MLALALTTVGCSKGAKSGGAAAPAPSAPAPAPVSVSDVHLGRSVGADHRVTERVEVFLPSDTIYASVLTRGAAARATLRARWTYEDGQLVSESEQAIAPAGDAATEFHIQKPDGWPAGRYRLEVFLDGRSVQTKEFEVKAA
jgi:hypothetical protein